MIAVDRATKLFLFSHRESDLQLHLGPVHILT